MGRRHGNAHGAAQRHVLAQAPEGIGKHIDQLTAAVFQQFLIGDTPHQHHEFVAADSGNDILSPEDLPDLLCHVRQPRIAEEVTVAVIDLLEIVQIQDQQSAAGAGIPGKVFFRLLPFQEHAEHGEHRFQISFCCIHRSPTERMKHLLFRRDQFLFHQVFLPDSTPPTRDAL